MSEVVEILTLLCELHGETTEEIAWIEYTQSVDDLELKNELIQIKDESLNAILRILKNIQ